MILSYSPIHGRIYPVFVLYIFISAFGVAMAFLMYKKWKARRLRPPLLIFLVFLSFSIAVIGLFFGLLETVIFGEFREVYRFSLPFGYTMMVAADVLLYEFANQVMEDRITRVRLPLYVAGVVIGIMLWLPWNWWGVPNEDYVGKLNIRLYTTLLFIVYSYVIYIMIIVIVFKVRQITTSPVARWGYTLLILSIVCLILFFAMFILDTLLIVFFDHPGYSEFVYLAWMFSIVFYILIYMSLSMPKWLVSRLQDKQ
ncbi:MAG: hypothetical protein ACTSRA_10715 [Promethearchaeota archaeon]